MKSRMILAAATLGTVVSSSAFAEGDGISARADSKIRAQAQIEMLPLGSGSTTFGGGISLKTDNAAAYGVSAMFDYAVTPYLSIGVAPRLVLNVIQSDAPQDAKASKALDLRARLLGHVP